MAWRMSVSPSLVSVVEPHAASPSAAKPHLVSRLAAAGVVNTGWERARPRRWTRSKWSPCRCESTTASRSGSWSGCRAGSVTRFDQSPFPR
jgi:hypothetical protein